MSAEIWQAIVLGIVQGLTEFLPVSSTGHLILVPWLFGWEGGVVSRLDFDIALHVGTLVALLVVFWRDWVTLAAAALRSLRSRSLTDPQARMAWLLVAATIPGALAGLLFQRYIETVLRSPLIIGSTMVIVGLLLAAIDHAAAQRRDELSLGPLAAIAIGIGQAFALIPGVSRSGATMAVGLGVGLTRAAAARFSFLLSTPIILGAVGKEAVGIARHGLPGAELLTFCVGMLASGISGYLCIRILLAYLRRRSLMPFVIYRVAVGLFVIGLALSGRF